MKMSTDLMQKDFRFVELQYKSLTLSFEIFHEILFPTKGENLTYDLSQVMKKLESHCPLSRQTVGRQLLNVFSSCPVAIGKNSAVKEFRPGLRSSLWFKTTQIADAL